MDSKGFEQIQQVLETAGIDAKVTPRPEEGEHVRFVAVETGLDVPQVRVLNLLDETHLIQYNGIKAAIMHSRPELNVLAVQPGNIIFEDKNDHDPKAWDQ